MEHGTFSSEHSMCLHAVRSSFWGKLRTFSHRSLRLFTRGIPKLLVAFVATVLKTKFSMSYWYYMGR